ncbi:MAG: WG repeat-containing protein [Oscillospiraceae bacterium]|nr:WG repeat-containing protein [Oscillospiraceae bacterium]
MRRKFLVVAIILALAICVVLVANSVFFGHSENRVNTFEFGGEYFSIGTLLSPSFEIYRPEPFSEGMSHVRRVYVPSPRPHEGTAVSTLQHTNNIVTLTVVPTMSRPPTLTKSGFVNSSGEIVIPLEYDDALCFSEGLAAVQIGDRWGFIDKTGEVVIPFEFSRVAPFREGLAKVEREDGMWSFINRGGNEVIPLGSYPQRDGSWMPHVWGFHEGLAAVRRDSGWGYIDREGNVVIPFHFQRGAPFSDGFAWVGSDVMIDRDGNQIGFNFLSSFSEGLAIVIVSQWGEWALVDTTGNVVDHIDQSDYDRFFYF